MKTVQPMEQTAISLLQTAPLDPDSTEMAGPFFTQHGIAAVPDGFHAEIASFPVDCKRQGTSDQIWASKSK